MEGSVRARVMKVSRRLLSVHRYPLPPLVSLWTLLLPSYRRKPILALRSSLLIRGRGLYRPHQPKVHSLNHQSTVPSLPNPQHQAAQKLQHQQHSAHHLYERSPCHLFLTPFTTNPILKLNRLLRRVLRNPQCHLPQVSKVQVREVRGVIYRLRIVGVRWRRRI
jgi:hypothetical protein